MSEYPKDYEFDVPQIYYPHVYAPVPRLTNTPATAVPKLRYGLSLEHALLPDALKEIVPHRWGMERADPTFPLATISGPTLPRVILPEDGANPFFGGLERIHRGATARNIPLDSLLTEIPTRIMLRFGGFAPAIGAYKPLPLISVLAIRISYDDLRARYLNTLKMF